MKQVITNLPHEKKIDILSKFLVGVGMLLAGGTLLVRKGPQLTTQARTVSSTLAKKVRQMRQSK